MWKCCSCFTKTYEAPEVLELDYRHSSLTEVPADVFSFERTLEKLDLGSNQISDLPPSLFHCHELKELDLCDNDLMSIPPAVGSLTRLCKLDLSRNGITDIADAIKNCKNLVYFDLSMNHLTKLPEGISQLVNLEELFLNDTYLEFLHANFGRLTKLKVLEIRENSIQSLPKSMSRLHHLQRLDIGQNDMSELPEVIGTMTNLTELWADNNNLRSIPKFIGNLTKLNCLDVSQNEIQEIADEISKCTQLVDMTLNSNSLENLPDSFAKLESLTVLRLDSNSIQYLPEEFGNLKNLQELSMVSNSLKKLPASIGLLRKLHTLYLDDNFLSELPKEIGSCTSLSVFSVAKNQLKEIPSEIGHLSNLKVFTLSGNLIIHLPVSILNIQKLGALWLSESQSKPLLQLNKEIDPASGQHVLTCYLLPQLPSNGDDSSNQNPLERKEEPLPPRRSRPSIKFMTDVEPAVVENNVTKRGLLRAPTPYPKELRALAKHASHLRQSKELNGEVANMDEPEYEGDFTEEEGNRVDGGKTVKNGLASSKPLSVHDNSRVMPGNVASPSTSAAISMSVSIEASKVSNNVLPAPSSSFAAKQGGFNNVMGRENLTVGLPPSVSMNRPSTNDAVLASDSVITTGHTDHRVQIEAADLHVPASHTSAYNSNLEESFQRSKPELQLNENHSSQGARFIGLPDVPDKSSRESYGTSSSELARKSPPPYHVAARRAAFFRSSGGAGGVKVGGDMKEQQQPLMSKVSPLVGVRMFPVVNSESANSPSTSVAITSQHTVTPSIEMGQGSASVLNNTFTRSDDLPANLKSNRWDDRKPESVQLLGNEQLLNIDEDETDTRLIVSPESKFDRTYVISKDTDSTSDVVSSSVEENMDDIEDDEKALESQMLDESEVELRSKNLVETIETALESVDKRTTEFLRHDKWEPDSDEMTELSNTNITPGSGLLISDGISENESQTSNSLGIRNLKPSGIVPPSYSLKGPVPPPKPSPLLARNLNPGINLASESYDTSYAGVSKVDSYTKIPLFSNTATSTNLNKPSNNEVAATMLSSSQASRIIPVSSVIHTTVPAHRNYEIATSGPVNAPPTTSGNSLGIGSRIPSKLPSFSSTNTSGFHATAIPKPQEPLSTVHQKPEITTAKPASAARATTPSRIPSFGSGDGPIPPNPKIVPSLSTPTNLSGLSKYQSDSPSSSNLNTSAYNSRLGPATAKISSSNISSPNTNSGVATASISTTKIPKFGESPVEKQELKRSTSGTRIPKFSEPSSNSNVKPVSPVASSVGSDSSSLDNATALSENNNENISSPSNIPTPGGGNNSSSSSKIPAFANRKPWIFGTHKNARVVPVEFKKINDLGFNICDGTGAGHTSDPHGIYVVATDSYDSTVKVGDKILQIDGIDVSNMGVEIVKKILGNCQENINLLVSRQS